MERTLFEVGDCVLQNVLDSFNTSEKSLQQDVITLTKWMQTQPHFPEIMEPKTLQNFLIQNKFSIERCKQKIDMYYTIKSKLPEIYGTINPNSPGMHRARSILYSVLHPRLTKEMCRVLFMKVRNKDRVNELLIGDISRNFINLQELRMREDVVFGDVMVLDCQGLAPLLFKVTPMSMYKSTVLIYERVYSLRLKKVYLLNLPAVGEKILSIVKKIMLPKLFERIEICTAETLKESFPIDMLPKDYGGEGYSLEELKDMWDAKFLEKKDFYDRLDQTRIHENLRPGKLKDDDILGVYGNFKKVDLD
ncbi:hypothetical protein Zmor_018193 [Zophobas morio]|uniref:CRAL-TRIO domain-containing protein n=2 Tax=Zophobas morio TaxID=2755281 RepID=A0AA38MDB5_9CUCU|nr:hypothetical protein Zmor_018193 [Zophobas morio]